MRRLHIIISILCCAGIRLQAQQGAQPIDFFPNRAGDTLQYWDSWQGGFSTHVFTHDSLGSNGEIFLTMKYTEDPAPNNVTNLKIDTAKNRVEVLNLGYENLLYKPFAVVGESWQVSGSYWMELLSISDTSVLGLPTVVKYYALYGGDSLFRRTRLEVIGLAAGFGEIAHYIVEGIPEYYDLIGAVIGGKKYGKIYPVAGVQEPGVATNEVMVYPNPASSGFSIRSTGNGIAWVGVYDPLGRRVLERVVNGNDVVHCDVSQYATGAYRVLIRYRNGGLQSLPVVVQR